MAQKITNFVGWAGTVGLFMASRDGLMGYGYEIRLHNVGPTGRQRDSKGDCEAGLPSKAQESRP